MAKETCQCGNEVEVKDDPKQDLLKQMLEEGSGKKVTFVIAGCAACIELEGVKNEADRWGMTAMALAELTHEVAETERQRCAAILDDVLENLHGGGNGRRLIIQARSLILNGPHNEKF